MFKELLVLCFCLVVVLGIETTMPPHGMGNPVRARRQVDAMSSGAKDAINGMGRMAQGGIGMATEFGGGMADAASSIAKGMAGSGPGMGPPGPAGFAMNPRARYARNLQDDSDEEPPEAAMGRPVHGKKSGPHQH